MTIIAAHVSASNAHFAVPQAHISHHARDLRSRVHQALQHGDRHLVVDCEAWDRLDLGMLSSLIQCASACREHGASFEVANMSSAIRNDVRELRLGSRLGLAD